MNNNQLIHQFLNRDIPRTKLENTYVEPQKRSLLSRFFAGIFQPKEKPGENLPGVMIKTIYPPGGKKEWYGLKEG